MPSFIGKIKALVPSRSTGTQVATLSGAAARFVAKVGDQAKQYAEPMRLVLINDLTASRGENLTEIRKILDELEPMIKAAGIKVEIGIANFSGNGFLGMQWGSLSEAKAILGDATLAGGATHYQETFTGVVDGIQGKKVDGIIITGDTIDGDTHVDFARLAQSVVSRGVPIFAFHEGHDDAAEQAFKTMAQVSKGALDNGLFAKFEPGSMRQLAGLFKVVVAMRSGNASLIQAVRNDKSITGPGRQLLEDLRK